jgi:hypothetical protein
MRARMGYGGFFFPILIVLLLCDALVEGAMVIFVALMLVAFLTLVFAKGKR